MSDSKDTNDASQYTLTPEDIEKLIKSPFDKKIDITKKIAQYYKNGGFDAVQMQNAAQIFRTLVKDTEVEIRKTLSEAIKDQHDIPKDVIMSLANDVNDVSLPVLQFSDILTDADLIEIVNSTEDINKQIGITKRKNVSEAVSEALVETGNDEVVGSLLTNDAADVSHETFEKIVEDFGASEKVMSAMVERETLPVTVVENLANRISETIYKSLSEKHKDAFVRMDKVMRESREMATMKVIGLRTKDAQYIQFRNLMEKLKISDDLAPIYALCMGNINIFEVNVARLTKTPVLNIRTLISDSSNRGFQVVYERAGLPADLYKATEVLMSVLRKMIHNKEIIQEGIFATKETAALISNRISLEIPDADSVKNLDYILSLVHHNAVASQQNNED